LAKSYTSKTTHKLTTTQVRSSGPRVIR